MFSKEEMESFKPQIQPEAPAEEPEESLESEEQAIDVDYEPEELKETNEDTGEENKKRSTMIPRDRFDEVNSKVKELEQKLQQAEWRAQQKDEALTKMLGYQKGDDGADEDDEILDTALADKFGKEIEGIKKQQLAGSVNSDIALSASQYPDIRSAEAWYVASNAASILERAQFAGKSISKEDALAYAKRAVDEELQVLYSNNPRPGITGEYLYRQAKNMGYDPQAGQSRENKVNMKKVDQLRKQAGAPTVQKESVRTGSGSENWKSSLAKKNKERGLSEKLTMKWFG